MSSELFSGPVKRRIGQSATLFLSVVKPLLEGKLGGTIESVEAVTDSPIAKSLDILAGIDAWSIKSPEGIRGIASRVQAEADAGYRTFTVRKLSNGGESEYGRRLRAMRDDLLYPYWTVQAYVTTGLRPRLCAAALARTVDVYDMIKRERCTLNARDNPFYVIQWRDMREDGYDITTWQPVDDMLAGKWSDADWGSYP